MHLFKNSNNSRCCYARTCGCVYVCLVKFTIWVSAWVLLHGFARTEFQNFTSSPFAEHLNVNKKNRPYLGRVEAEILVTPRCATCVHFFLSHRMQDIDVVLLVVFPVDSSYVFPTTLLTHSWRYWSTQRTALNIGRKKRSQLWGSNLQLKFTSLLRVLPIVSSILRCDSHRFLKFYAATVVMIRRKRKHAQGNAMRHSHVLPVVLWMLLCCLPPFSIAMVALKILTRLLLSDDDTKFEEILLGSHTRTRTHTHTHTPSPGYFPRQHSKYPFLSFFFVVCYCCCWCCCCCCLLFCNLYRSFSMIFFL